jgi:2'-5' RNA ligase
LQLSSEYDQLLSELHRRTHYDSINWVANDLSHLTLRFIGKTPSSQLRPLADTLQTIAAHTPSLDLEINKLGVFGSHYAPKVLWLGIEKTPQLQQLYVEVDEALKQMGFILPKENFVPHITLGRIKEIDNKKRFWKMYEEIQPVYNQQFHFTQLSLVRSQLEKYGPIYTTLNDFPLSGINS